MVVEGVETLEEVSLAERLGGDALQGFYFSPALPVAELERWLEEAASNPQHKQLEQLQRAMAS